MTDVFTNTQQNPKQEESVSSSEIALLEQVSDSDSDVATTAGISSCPSEDEKSTEHSGYNTPNDSETQVYDDQQNGLMLTRYNRRFANKGSDADTLDYDADDDKGSEDEDELSSDNESTEGEYAKRKDPPSPPPHSSKRPKCH